MIPSVRQSFVTHSEYKGLPQPPAMSFGEPHHHFERIDSTNTRARELAAEGASHGTVVTAGEQTAGRGRQGRTWTAPPGKALLYSAIVRPLDERHLMLPLAVPLAVCAAAEELATNPSIGSREKAKADTAAANPKPLRCMVKWPNDVLVDRPSSPASWSRPAPRTAGQ